MKLQKQFLFRVFDISWILDFPDLSRQAQKLGEHLKIQKSQLTRDELVGLILLFTEYPELINDVQILLSEDYIELLYIISL